MQELCAAESVYHQWMLQCVGILPGMISNPQRFSSDDCAEKSTKEKPDVKNY